MEPTHLTDENIKQTLLSSDRVTSSQWFQQALTVIGLLVLVIKRMKERLDRSLPTKYHFRRGIFNTVNC